MTPNETGHPLPHDVAASLAHVKLRIAAAAREAGRDPAAVNLVAVAKTHPASTIEIAIKAGHRLFGENRVQEAAGKWPDLKARYPDIALHLIGPLQTNKRREAIRLFDTIETLDREKLARALVAERDQGRLLPRCFIQVNIGEEVQKAGIALAEVDGFIRLCRDELALPIDGLMCIPPQDEAPAPFFALLGEIARRNDIATLSMGMSCDYEIAVKLGATHVRVGSAIFGARGPA
ncbi:MAG: YggS family pyridoxal phosphate-dependent enzyme [Rhodospirillaceae bacterium]|nr:YggS family pyridoxal phosphate-dependent enzyme [Rhodospirillaceae bacterium]